MQKNNSSRLFATAVLACVGLVACDSDDPSRNGEKSTHTEDDGTPKVELVITPLVGQTPHTILADVSGSTDSTFDTSELEVRFDIDGTGTWDTEFSSDLKQNFTYHVVGQYTLRAEVRNPAGLSTIVEHEDPIVVMGNTTNPNPVANIDVDTNRDGLITAGDSLGEDTWAAKRGAIFLANTDDSDNSGIPDAWDSVVNGPNDLNDLAPMVLRQTHGVSANHKAYLTVQPAAAANRVRIFRQWSDDEFTQLYAPGAGMVQVDVDTLSDDDILLWIEAVESRSQSWDGHAEVKFHFEEDDTFVSVNSVALRVAPVVFPDNTRPAETVYIMSITNPMSAPNTEVMDSLQNNLPEDITLYSISPGPYGYDRWVQDIIQTGYQQMPHAAGDHVLTTYFNTSRYDGLETLLPNELLSPSTGYASAGGPETSHNYGGNLEVAPPHGDYPFGRIIIGGGNGGTLTGAPNADRMNQAQRNWLTAQEVQAPWVEVSSEWLYVGHIDEIFLFIPDPSNANGRSFKVAIAAPSLAWKDLKSLYDNGHGGAIVFPGRTGHEITVSEIYTSEAWAGYQTLAQSRIDSIQAKLMDSLGLDVDDFVEVPVLYYPEWFGWGDNAADFAVAYNPGIQNLLVASHTLFVPDPEGPQVGGVDIWKHTTSAALEPLGLDIHYVDVFESYHLLFGEIHCGTTVRHTPYAQTWWR